MLVQHILVNHFPPDFFKQKKKVEKENGGNVAEILCHRTDIESSRIALSLSWPPVHTSII